jgi:hypothetical protein
MALGYLKDHGITKVNSIYEGYSPFSLGGSASTKYDLNELNNKKFKYVVLSSNMYVRYLKEDKDGTYKKNIDFYNKVTKKKLVTKFQSKCSIITHKSKIPEITNLFTAVDGNCITGPELKIYQL